MLPTRPREMYVVTRTRTPDVLVAFAIAASNLNYNECRSGSP